MKYRISRILNNNAAICIDEKGNEVIVKGKGIAYQMKKGETIDPEIAEKVYVLKDPLIKQRYLEIVSSISKEITKKSEHIIDYIQSSITRELSPNIYVSLTDHISNLIERLNMGIRFNNTVLWDIKQIYKEEYKVGLEAVKMIRELFNVNVDDDEACFIALHIVNAEMNVDFHTTKEITKLIEDVYDIVDSDFKLNISKEELDYSRFISHLRFFFERLIRHETIAIEAEYDLLDILSNKYQKQHRCVKKIIEYINCIYPDVLDGEELYLMIHVIKLTSKRPNADDTLDLK